MKYIERKCHNCIFNEELIVDEETLHISYTCAYKKDEIPYLNGINCNDFVISFNEYIQLQNNKSMKEKENIRNAYMGVDEEERLARTYPEFEKIKKKGTLLPIIKNNIKFKKK